MKDIKNLPSVKKQIEAIYSMEIMEKDMIKNCINTDET